VSKADSATKTNLGRRDFLRRTAAALTCVGLRPALATARSQGRAAGADYSTVIEDLKQLVPAFMARKNMTAAAVALVEGGRVLWAEGFGHTDRSRGVKVTADTPFFVGSISKSFTALGILKAAGKGLLSLDDPLVKHLPWFKVNSRFGEGEAAKITLRHLLSHHSGLGTWPPLGNPYDSDYHARTFEEVVRSTRDSWLKFPPGARFEYCNQGLDLAGYALQTAADKPFADFMREEVLAPLGMASSTFAAKEVTARGGFAVPYEGDAPVPIRHGVVHPQLAAGGLVSTAADLARFVAFQLTGKAGGREVVGPGLLAEMCAPQLTARGEASGYGLCVYRAVEHDTPRLSHGGFGYGISTHYRWLPEHGLGVVVLTNEGAEHSGPELASRAVELLLRAKLGALPRNRPPAPVGRPTAAPDDTALRRLEGTYLLYEGILARFKFEGGRLIHQDGREKLRLEARGPLEFSAGSREYRFLLGEGGAPEGVRFRDPYYDPSTAENSVLFLPFNHAGGRGPNEREWARYEGKYAGAFMGGPAAAEISLKDGFLFLNGGLRLTEHAPDLFFTADGDAVIFKGDRLTVGNKPFLKKR
jgi:CubicO group peptidase (beta-lactamase class C family)